MSIEASGTAASPKTVASTESRSSKSTAKSGEAANAPEGGGFLALLTSLESDAPVGVGGVGAAAQIEAVDAPLSDEEKTKMAAALPSSDPSILLAQSLPNDLAMLLAQAGKVADDKLSTFSDGRPGGAKGGIRLIAAAIGTDKPEMAIAKSAQLVVNKSGDFSQNADALLEQSALALPAMTSKPGGAELQSGAAATLAESRALKLSAHVDVSAKESALSGALLTSGMGDSFVRQADRAVAKSSALSAGSGIEGAWGAHALLTGNRVDSPSAMSDSSMLSPERMVADTVSYWVTQGVQNAELKLDGFGSEPVEVSISLRGDEAHIDFRTDQPEIRQVLEGAVAHLKDLLISEGLVLSGVSVGTSGQDGTGPQERRNRPGARQATITTTEVVPTESRQRANQSVGRAVDLFV